MKIKTFDSITAWFIFIVQNILGLYDTKAIVVLNSSDAILSIADGKKGIHAFLSSIIPIMNASAQLEFKLPY